MRTTKAMRSMLTAALVLAFSAVGTMPAAGLQDGGNGYLLMVHTTFEPRPQDDGVPGPAAQEAFAGTQDEGKVVLRFIPYTTDGLEPVVVEDPLVAVTSTGPQIEHYNSVGHVLLHDAIEGGAADPQIADATFTQPTPVVVETAVDPQP